VEAAPIAPVDQQVAAGEAAARIVRGAISAAVKDVEAELGRPLAVQTKLGAAESKKEPPSPSPKDGPVSTSHLTSAQLTELLSQRAGAAADASLSRDELVQRLADLGVTSISRDERAALSGRYSRAGSDPPSPLAAGIKHIPLTPRPPTLKPRAPCASFKACLLPCLKPPAF